MKKFNKKGMTLTEVIVAMAIFGIMSAAIITALSVSVKYTQRSKMRDTELAQQAAAVGKHQDTDLSQIGATKFTINFNDITHPAMSKTTDVNLFSANEKQFGSQFGFNLKTFQQGALTNMPTSLTPSATDEYKVKIENNYASGDITVVVNITDGYIFEGANDSTTGYIHTSTYYARTIKPGKSAEFGYYNDSPTASSFDMHVNNASGVTLSVGTISSANLAAGAEKVFQYGP